MSDIDTESSGGHGGSIDRNSWSSMGGPMSPNGLSSTGLSPSGTSSNVFGSSGISSSGLSSSNISSSGRSYSSRTSSRYGETTSGSESAESDIPGITVSTTSEEDEGEATPQASVRHLLTVGGAGSGESTDIGSEYSDGAESSYDAEDMMEPSDELAAALLKLMEEYFSDDHLAKDLFMLKHVKRNKEGFVSLKLLSGYKKIKKISRDWRVLAKVLENSTQLEVNEERNKVKRRTPLPEMLQYDIPSSRVLVAAPLPTHLSGMDSLASLFGTHGTVGSLQVVRPRPGAGAVPQDIKTLAERVPNLLKNPLAVVEYENVWDAAKALKHIQEPEMSLYILRRQHRLERPVGLPGHCNLSPSSSPRTQRHYTKLSNGVCATELRSRLKEGTGRFTQFNNPDSSASDCEETTGSWRQVRSAQPSPRPVRRLVSRSTPTSPFTHRRLKKGFGASRDPLGPDGTSGFSRPRTPVAT